MPYWTTDVGGFFVGRRPDLWFWDGDFDAGVADLGYRELYLRWFQYAAWLPMLRSHGTDTPREMWRFGEPGEAVHDALVEALRLRYRLLPYLYSMAGWTTQRAYTMLRALAFDFRDGSRRARRADQFLFGPAFLVCPVVARSTTDRSPASRRGRRRRGRSGCRPARTGSTYGPTASTRVGRRSRSTSRSSTSPVFVRAGSIVPDGAGPPARRRRA